MSYPAISVAGSATPTDSSLTAALTQASQRPPDAVAAAVREHLHRAPVLTNAIVEAVAAQVNLEPTTVREIAEAPSQLRTVRTRLANRAVPRRHLTTPAFGEAASILSDPACRLRTFSYAASLLWS